MGHIPIIDELAAIAALGVVVTLILARLQLPAVAGLLFAGALAGPAGFGMVKSMDAIEVLYPKLSPGGFLIVDDYGAVPACKRATEDYRNRNGIAEPIVKIEGGGAFWRKA